MSVELTNFLPEERLRAQRADYRYRLATLALIGLAVLVVVHGILLIPSYMYVADKNDALRARIASFDANAQTAGAGNAGALAHTQADAGRLSVLAATTPASDLVRAILAVGRPGIVLESFAYSAGNDPRLVLTGTATTRDALRAYDVALAGLPYVKSADLPLSAFAKDSNIDFSITLTGPLTP